MRFKTRLGRLAAPAVALALAAAPAGALAQDDGFGFVKVTDTSIDYRGDRGQDALLTLSVRVDGSGERAVVDAVNNIDADGSQCTEAPLNHVECTPARPQWTVLSFELPDVIDNLSDRGLTATLGAGDDTVTSRDGADHLFGQEGRDTLTTGGGTDELDGGDGDDILRAGGGPDTARGGGGSDYMDGAEGNDFLTGGDGNDHLIGGDGSDVLSAGAGNDAVEGGSGADAIGGNEGDDRLVGGPGGDSFSGGPGVDTADFSERVLPLRISLDDAGNDGQEGEADNVTSDVENLVGGADNDRIVGGAHDNGLVGNGGGDLLIGNGGTDAFDGGDGDDVLQSRDGIPERLVCGTGTDTAIMDEFDTPVDCENVYASREFQSDVDADGFASPADCNDRDAAIRPGAVDTPHNGVDEDCSGADGFLPAARGTIVHAFQTRGRLTRVIRLQVVRAQIGATVRVRCTGRRCTFTRRSFRVRSAGSRVDLTRLFRRRTQRSGGTVEVSIVERGHQSRVTRFRFRARRAPSVTRRCLAPGAVRTTACP